MDNDNRTVETCQAYARAVEIPKRRHGYGVRIEVLGKGKVPTVQYREREIEWATRSGKVVGERDRDRGWK